MDHIKMCVCVYICTHSYLSPFIKSLCISSLSNSIFFLGLFDFNYHSVNRSWKEVLFKKKDKNDCSSVMLTVFTVKSDVLSLCLCFVSCQRRLLERKGLAHENIYLFHIVFNLWLCGI